MEDHNNSNPQLLVINLMDPRPFNYEYRRPRLSNPTLYAPPHSASLAASTKASITSVPIPASTPTATNSPIIPLSSPSRPPPATAPTNSSASASEPSIPMPTTIPPSTVARNSTRRPLSATTTHSLRVLQSPWSVKATIKPGASQSMEIRARASVMSPSESTLHPAR